MHVTRPPHRIKDVFLSDMHSILLCVSLNCPFDREFIRLTNVKRVVKKKVLKDSIHGYAGEYQPKLHST